MTGAEKFTPGKSGGGQGPTEEAPAWADDDLYDAAGFDGDINNWCAWRAGNDLGNAERFIARFGEDLIYVEKSGWYAWDGVRWNREDGPRRVQIAAQRTAKAIRAEAKVVENRKVALMEWARDSGSSGKISAMQKEAKPHLSVRHDDLDCDHFLFTCHSHTVRLGPRVQAQAHDRDDKITRTGGAGFDESADAPVFHAFLEKIMPDKRLRRFLQTWFGYCLTGDISEQVMVLLLGNGSNGKSTLLNCIDHVIGDYHMSLPIESLMRKEGKQGSGPSPDIARLPGARMVTTSEPETGAQFSESIIKQITGGEKIVARHLQESFFEFIPVFKVTVSMNNKPRIRGQDDGIWRRLLLVPFDQKVGKDDVTPVYAALEDEAAGIFRWMLEGVELWFEEDEYGHRKGLDVPEQIQSAVDEYRADSSPLSEFIADRVVLAGGDAESIVAGQLFATYKQWAADNGYDAWNMTMFGRRMNDGNYKKVKRGGLKHYLGMRLKDAAAVQAGEGGDSSTGDPRPEPPPSSCDGVRPDG